MNYSNSEHISLDHRTEINKESSVFFGGTNFSFNINKTKCAITFWNEIQWNRCGRVFAPAVAICRHVNAATHTDTLRTTYK